VTPSTPRGQPLSIRLALLLAVAVVGVLLVTGLAVNRLVSRSLADELSAAQRDRITLLAEGLSGIDVLAPGRRRGVQMVLQRVAQSIGGHVELVAADGTVLAAAGPPAGDGPTQRVEEPIPDTNGVRLVLQAPPGGQPFLRIFNLTLLIAGVLAVAALLLVSVLLANRLTRPLRGVAVAARRLGAGDLGARASGGPDRESAELADAFNAMADRLQRSEELRRRAASDMAHDLATPATVLESQLQAMVDGVVPADREQLEHGRAAASALSGVIGQLRDLVDAESAAFQRRPAPVRVDELLSEAAAALQPMFAARGVALDVAPVAATLTVFVDGAQVARAVRNVLANAGQHSPDGGRVSLSAESRPNETWIRVADQGAGIEEVDAPHVFERFYRADPARNRGAAGEAAGSGIGLTIARELLRANAGDAWLEQTGPRGTTFAIRLPASAPAGLPAPGARGS
jgi:two-component system sensor histidine kinase BaeS